MNDEFEYDLTPGQWEALKIYASQHHGRRA